MIKKTGERERNEQSTPDKVMPTSTAQRVYFLNRAKAFIYRKCLHFFVSIWVSTQNSTGTHFIFFYNTHSANCFRLYSHKPITFGKQNSNHGLGFVDKVPNQCSSALLVAYIKDANYNRSSRSLVEARRLWNLV